jgi:soluble cytochrome b562
MNCPRCGKPLAGGAAFCMHCGQMLAGGAAQRPAQQMTGAMPAYAPSAIAIPADVKKRNTWLAIGISAAVLLLLFFGLNATGALHLGTKPPDQATLNARGQLTDSTLQAKGGPTNPTLAATRVTMPDDIRNWLEHLARIERKKQALTNKQLEQAHELQGELQGASGLTSPEDVSKMSDPDYNSFPSIEKAGAMIAQLQPDWKDLQKEFDSVPPPKECQPIADQYDSGFDAMIETFDEIEKIVNGINLTDQKQMKSSVDDARKAGRSSRRGIDGSFEKTDDLVQKICDKYETRKWFKIDAHGGSTGLMGF